MQNSAPANSIDPIIVDVLLAGRILAGTRLGEQCLVTLFSVSRTVLNSALYQSSHNATISCDEHEAITDALAEADLKRAADLMISHIGNVEAGLTRAKDDNSLTSLRQALELLNTRD